MSDPIRILVLGASGLVGQQVLAAAVGRADVRLVGLARREVPLPQGARMEIHLAPVEGWAQEIAAIAPDRVICALGTTIAKQGGDKAAFAAIDRDLVLEAAARTGRVALVGWTGQLEANTILAKGLTVYGAWHYRQQEVTRLFQVIRASRAAIDQLITHRFPMREIQRAWELQASGNCGKVILYPWA